MAEDITNLEQMLDVIQQAAVDKERVSLDTVVKAVGARSFGSLLLVCGVVMASPLSGIPGMPTTMGLFALLIAGQLLFRKQSFWLPQWLLKKSVSRSKVFKSIKWLRHPARFVDRLLRPRLPFFIRGVSLYAIAMACVIIAAGTPLMELVPFLIHGAGLALTAFGLALIAHDGLFALVAFVVTSFALGFAVYQLCKLWPNLL